MKVLIIGGHCQGKLDYTIARFGLAAEDIVDGAAPTANLIAPVINHLHLLVRRLMEEGANPQLAVLSALDSRESWIVLCDEVGCGVVPTDREDRRWREETGRLCVALAQRADLVERVTCGIGLRLKGETTC